MVEMAKAMSSTLRQVFSNLRNTLPKTNMDTQNDGLEKVTPFKHGNFWYLC